MSEYSAATDGRVPVIPDIASGFNDRGFRLATNHPAQPRQWLPGEGPASTLDHLFRCVAIPEVSPTLPMVMVTSWNDWNEDTGIEPIGGTPTNTDDSPSGQAYTQGYTYGGEGRQALKVLRADVNLLDRRFDGRTRIGPGRESGGLVLTTRPTWSLRTGRSRRRRVVVHAHHEHG